MAEQQENTEGIQDTCTLVRDQTAIIIAADEGLTRVLGWQQDDVVGKPSTNLIHPDDQNGAVAAWFEMLEHPGGSTSWQGRYRTAAGSWQWVLCTNTNHLADPDQPRVVTVMTPVDVSVEDIAEELRVRKQLLSRLADAIPVGLMQFDCSGAVTFTNDQLHELVGVSDADTVDEQLGTLLPQDRAALQTAISAVLRDQTIAPVELHFRVPGEASEPVVRVCELSLRPLTDSAGMVNGGIACLSDVTARVQVRRDLQIRASTDALTGCLNRPAILEFLELAAERAREHDSGVAVLYIDLNSFKGVNDLHGHATGDSVLVELATRLRATIREGDEIGRLGGDEFLVVCPDVGSRTVAELIAERARTGAQGEILSKGVRVSWAASVGMAWANEEIRGADLVAEADNAMYAAKSRLADAARP